jgi:hypothetical protein
MQEIKGEDYTVTYNPATATLNFQGLLRLQGLPAYAAITASLNDMVERKPVIITLDLRELTFLNSSGIDMLLKFVIKIRKQQVSQLVIKVSEQVPWHKKSLNNLQRLMPTLRLEFDK